MLRIDLLLRNGSINTFPRGQILDKQPLLGNAHNDTRQYRTAIAEYRINKQAAITSKKPLTPHGILAYFTNSQIWNFRPT
jgi:hypothetical protein